MGLVFEAEQLGLDRRVAVKVLVKKDARALARLRREALATASLRSPHVVAVLDFQANEGEPPFLVMELLEGESLHAVLVREKAIAPARAVKIASQVLAALHAAHEAGLVHRDVKPSNVWLSPSPAGEVVKLLDFGLVKDTSDPRFQTTAGTVLGTPAYAAPEQIMGSRVDARADLHGVGVLLFIMLSGRRPFDPASLAAEIMTKVPVIEEHVPDVAPALSAVIGCALEKDPADRFQSAQEMLDALMLVDAKNDAPTLVDPSELPPRPPPVRTVRNERRRKSTNRRVFFVTAGAVLVCGAFAIGVALGERARRQRAESAPPPVSSVVAEPFVAVVDASAVEGVVDAAVTRTAPPGGKRAAPVAAPARCWCEAIQPPHQRLCPAPVTPQCLCLPENPKDPSHVHRAACPKIADVPCIPKGSSVAINGAPSGRHCAVVDGDTWIDGFLSCSLCDEHGKPGTGQHGTQCRGADARGSWVDSVWVCEGKKAPWE